MKAIIDAALTALAADQNPIEPTHEITGLRTARNLATTSTLKMVDLVEIQFRLKNIATGEVTLSTTFAAQKDEMIKFAKQILSTAEQPLSENRTIN